MPLIPMIIDKAKAVMVKYSVRTTETVESQISDYWLMAKPECLMGLKKYDQ